MEFDYQEYHNRVRETLLDHPYIRQGQAMFNILYEMYPELAEQIRGTDLDPFHFDDGVRIYHFWQWIAEQSNQ